LQESAAFAPLLQIARAYLSAPKARFVICPGNAPPLGNFIANLEPALNQLGKQYSQPKAALSF
jgi:hypothetical protein